MTQREKRREIEKKKTEDKESIIQKDRSFVSTDDITRLSTRHLRVDDSIEKKNDEGRKANEKKKRDKGRKYEGKESRKLTTRPTLYLFTAMIILNAASDTRD